NNHWPVIPQHGNLQEEGKASSQQSEEKSCYWHPGSPIAQHIFKTMDGIWRIYFMDFNPCTHYGRHCSFQHILILINTDDEIFILFHTYLLTFSDEDFKIDFISNILITGKNLANKKNNVKNKPNVNK